MNMDANSLLEGRAWEFKKKTWKVTGFIEVHESSSNGLRMIGTNKGVEWHTRTICSDAWIRLSDDLHLRHRRGTTWSHKTRSSSLNPPPCASVVLLLSCTFSNKCQKNVIEMPVVYAYKAKPVAGEKGYESLKDMRWWISCQRCWLGKQSKIRQSVTLQETHSQSNQSIRVGRGMSEGENRWALLKNGGALRQEEPLDNNIIKQKREERDGPRRQRGEVAHANSLMKSIIGTDRPTGAQGRLQ